MILTLPTEEKSPDNWEAFNLALESIGLSLIEIPDENDGYVKVKINSESEEQEQTVIDLLQLCFSKYYRV